MNKKYILYGAGVCGRRAMRELGKNNVAYFCDNQEKNKVEGIDVISIEKLKKIHNDFTVVVSVEKKEAIEQITKILKENVIPFIS